MFKPILIILSLLSFQLFSQTKEDYLKTNRFDMTQNNFEFPQQDFKVLGFGVYHGSAKSENVEYSMLEDLVLNGKVKYYLPETDYSTAYYFNTFLTTGDTVLLKDLVRAYGDRVPQEKSIEVYEKWKKLKALNTQVKQQYKLKVVGVDKMACFKYPIKHLLTLIKPELDNHKSVALLKTPIKDHASYSAYYDSEARVMLKAFVNLYEENEQEMNKHIKNVEVFKHIIKNIKHTYTKENEREATIYENYVELMPKFKFDSRSQFVRFGFFHLEKSREGKKGYPSFFTRLIENNIHKREDVITVIGYLTKSKVLWDCKYSKEGKYNGYTIKRGYGIGDYWLERFKGIRELKNSKLSDITLFRLNKPNSPYLAKEADLMEIVMLLKKSNKERLKGMSTLDFIDYSILISNSDANIPIQELK